MNSTLRNTFLAVCAMSVAPFSSAAQSTSPESRIGAYLQPYVSSGNFSGAILVVQSGKTLFRNSYGLADVIKRVPNRVDTKFHIASVSFQFTAAATMRLVAQGKLSFDTKVSEIVPGVPNGDKITIRNLLRENSGLADPNDLPGYDEVLKVHQTPETAFQFVRNQPPIHEPGAASDDEERTAYNVLAMIIEKKTGLSFKQAMKQELFAPLKMTQSGIDDDGPIAPPVALGYLDSGTVNLKPAPTIHFSAKPGSGSAYATIDDAHRWLTGLFDHSFLSDADLKEILDWGDGYGWTRTSNHGLKDPAYLMRGEGPGFASIIIYLPKLKAEIIIFSNVQAPIPTEIAFDLAALLEGREYHALELRTAPLSADEISQVVGHFKFGADFYRSNATLELAASEGGLILKWPGGPDSPVLVTDSHHFIDRHYWSRFSVADDANGRPSELTFAKFKGQRSEETKP